MRRFGFACAGAGAGYLAAAAAGYALVLALSSNAHDRALEAAMTSAFVLGPVGAVVAGAAAFALGGRERR